MIGRLQLVEDWRRSWRWASVRLAWLAGAAAAFLTAYPEVSQQVVSYVPERWRPLAALVVVAVLPTLARILRKRPSDG